MSDSNERYTAGGRLSDVQVLTLASIVTGANQGARLRWLPEPDADEAREGTMRRLDAYDGREYTGATDVRDMHVHVTTRAGGEVWAPVREVACGVDDRTHFIG